MDCPKSQILRFKVFGVHSDSGVNHSVLVGFEQFLSQNLTKHMFYSKEKNFKTQTKRKTKFLRGKDQSCLLFK